MNRFCTACGKNIEEDSQFCGACGKAIKPNGPSASASADNNAAASSAPKTPSPPPTAGATSGVTNNNSTSTRPLKVAQELPPETVFASGGGAIPPEPDPAYFEVGDDEDRGNLKLWLGGGAIALLLLSGLYYFLFIADDLNDSKGGRPTAEIEQPAEKPVEILLFHATSGANIRDKAAVEGSEILGKLQRGDEARGNVIQGEDDGGEWLKLEDDKGFVFLANLSDEKRPELAKKFGRKVIRLAAPATLLTAPSVDAEIIDKLSKGLKLTLSGITDGDYAEVLLRKGGVGYIENGAKIVEEGEGPRGAELAIKLNEQGCAAGSEVEALFKKLDARTAAALQKIEDADYPDEDAKRAALDKYYGDLEGKSQFEKLERGFKGLQVTAIARHYEAQAIYFAEPAAKVRKVFGDLGYKVSSDGQLESKDISAGIYSTRGNWQKYGASSLECGV